MNNLNPSYVLDSFAMLAFLGGESGAERVKSILAQAQQGRVQAYFSLINMGEVLYITERRRGLPLAQKTLAMIEQLPVKILPADREYVLAAAHIKANYPVAYADAFAIAVAQKLEATVITGDPEFASVENVIQVEWL